MKGLPATIPYRHYAFLRAAAVIIQDDASPVTEVKRASFLTRSGSPSATTRLKSAKHSQMAYTYTRAGLRVVPCVDLAQDAQDDARQIAKN